MACRTAELCGDDRGHRPARGLIGKRLKIAQIEDLRFPNPGVPPNASVRDLKSTIRNQQLFPFSPPPRAAAPVRRSPPHDSLPTTCATTISHGAPAPDPGG